MLENKLHDIPYILLLRSDRVLKDLLEMKLGEVSYSLIESLEDFYPNKFRKEAINNAYHVKCRNENGLNSLDYSFDCLDKLFDDYFVSNGLTIYANPKKLDRYSSIINKIHPFNIIGYRLAKELKENKIDLDEIEKLADTISPLGFNMGDGKRYSDNHIHLYGAREIINDVWTLVTRELFETDRNRISTFSTINNGNFTLLMLIDILVIVINVINDFIFDSKEISYSESKCYIQKILNNHSTYMKKSVNFHYIQESNKKRF